MDNNTKYIWEMKQIHVHRKMGRLFLVKSNMMRQPILTNNIAEFKNEDKYMTVSEFTELIANTGFEEKLFTPQL